MPGDALVYVEGLKVSFDGFLALDVGYFAVAENELRVVIGPNGAGKTTLCDVISGKTQASEGRVILGDVDIAGMTEEEMDALEDVMELPDTDLTDWLTGRREVPGDVDSPLLRKIVAFALHSEEWR